MAYGNHVGTFIIFANFFSIEWSLNVFNYHTLHSQSGTKFVVIFH
jgi:hypothetical protein